MGFKVVTTYSDFISACSDFSYGKNFKDLPDDVQEKFNEIYDDCECVDGEGCNPDDVWLNGFYEWTLDEALVDNLELLSKQEFREIKGHGMISEWVDENIEQIESAISDLGYQFLGRDGIESWYVLA